MGTQWFGRNGLDAMVWAQGLRDGRGWTKTSRVAALSDIVTLLYLSLAFQAPPLVAIPHFKELFKDSCQPYVAGCARVALDKTRYAMAIAEKLRAIQAAVILSRLLGAGDNGVRTTHTTGELENDWIRHIRC